MTEFWTSIITTAKDVAGKLRLVSAEANDRVVENRQLMQQCGFISIPKPGDRIAWLRRGNLVVGFATDSKDRPALDGGESAQFASSATYVLCRPDGTIEISAPGDVTIKGSLNVTGDVSDSMGKLSTLRTKFNAHTHVGNIGAPTSPPPPAQQDLGGSDA